MKTEIKMSETDQDDQSIPHSAISDSSFDTDGEDPDGDDSERMTNSTRNHVNVLTTFKEDSDTFAAIKTVLAVLFGLTAFGSTVMVYSLTRGYEIQVFESKFNLSSAKIADFSVENTRQTFEYMDFISSEITSNSLHANIEWPSYTIPHFEETVLGLFNVTYADWVDFSPIITNATKESWDEYTEEMRGHSTTVYSFGTNNQSDLIEADVEGNGQTIRYIPTWQVAPEGRLDSAEILNLLSLPAYEEGFEEVLSARCTILSRPVNGSLLNSLGAADNVGINFEKEEPLCFAINPIFDSFDKGSDIVGTLNVFLRLSFLFQGTLNDDMTGIRIIIRDTCGERKDHTYSINGNEVGYEGDEDLHDGQYDYIRVIVQLTDLLYEKTNHSPLNNCSLSMEIYPTKEYEKKFLTLDPLKFGGIVLAIFTFMGCLLLFYNRTVKKRQDFLMHQAVRTTNILTNLFPANVHERLFGREARRGGDDGSGVDGGTNLVNEVQNTVEDMGVEKVTRMMQRRSPNDDGLDNEVVNGMYTTMPIADLFPNTTIMFADIVGFTAWSSQREPTHVFTLLETIFRAFDTIAHQMDVFKVETIGDCYVAVAGLPHARNDHAVVMAMFAKECMSRMQALVRHMEVTLGPDTGDLSMRFGLHSGPVTAGVLRGDKSRFQLFGDSVNTAARIETTGERGKIHISQETAELLISAGHSKWVVPRRDLVTAKGKGVMKTYWLLKASGNAAHFPEDEEESDDDTMGHLSLRRDFLTALGPNDGDTWGMTSVRVRSSNRLIEWNVDVLYQLLTKVVAKRLNNNSRKSQHTDISLDLRIGLAALSEERRHLDVPDQPTINPKVKMQLRAYVTLIASMYRDHPFHNFEHASHVMLSITKLMSRITTPNTEDMASLGESVGGVGSTVGNGSSEEMSRETIDEMLHSHTYGIASDPLLQFSVAFSALIHDVDHAGVPNTQLVKEDVNLAKKYRFKSVAEKHSIRLAWERLMDSDYRELRSCLCPNQVDLKRFRNFVVNTVMATDIADKGLNMKRKERWHQCFEEWPECPSTEDVQRKATIVIEHLIQASDVAHTMQHFEVYKKWNERLFYEVYSAYDSGRGDTDPSEKWFEGEIGFFDHYIIPLAKKLEECKVFGVASDEYLNYAQDNRQKWTQHGRALVEQWLESHAVKKVERENNKKPHK